MTIRLTIASICAIAGFLTACGGGTKPSSATDCERPKGAGAVAAASHPSEAALLTAVSVESDGCVRGWRCGWGACSDRGSFVLGAGLFPGHGVRCAPSEGAPVEAGPGARGAADGRASLAVRSNPAATADISGPELVRTYRGPKR